MLGLFIKDLKLLKAQKKLFMLVGIVTAVVLFNIQDGTEMIGFMAGYMVFVVTMAATSTIGCDEADHGTVFLFTLPVSRKEYVLEKYGLAVAGSAAAVCVVTVLVYLVSVVRGSQLMAEQLFIILIMMPLALILFSLMVPFQLRFGAEKGRMMLLGAYGAVFGGLYILKKFHRKVECGFVVDWTENRAVFAGYMDDSGSRSSAGSYAGILLCQCTDFK